MGSAVAWNLSLQIAWGKVPKQETHRLLCHCFVSGGSGGGGGDHLIELGSSFPRACPQLFHRPLIALGKYHKLFKSLGGLRAGKGTDPSLPERAAKLLT